MVLQYGQLWPCMINNDQLWPNMSLIGEFFSVYVFIAQYGNMLRKPRANDVQKIVRFSELENTEC